MDIWDWAAKLADERPHAHWIEAMFGSERYGFAVTRGKGQALSIEIYRLG